MNLSENLLRATIAQLRSDANGRGRTSDKRFIGVQADSWLGPAQIEVGGEAFRVRECRSALAVRAAMDETSANEPRVVLVTPCTGKDLGADVEARVIHNRFQRPDAWQSIQGRFGAQRMAPGVPRPNWLRDLLLAIPEHDLPQLQTSDVLDLDTVRAAVFQALGMTPRPDLRSLLRWAESASAEAFGSGPAEQQSCVREWIGSSLGPAGTAIVDCVLAGNGNRARPLGLALRVLVGGAEVPGANPGMLAKAEGRLEAFLGGVAVSARDLPPWVEAAEELLRADVAQRCQQWQPPLDEADRIVEQFGLSDLAHVSNCLLSSLSRRELAFAAAVDRALTDLGTTTADVEQCARRIEEHTLARDLREGRLLALRMAVRLLRWLRAPISKQSDFRSMALEYAADASFADWAREVLDYPDPVQAALRRVWSAVMTRRETFSRRFAEAAREHFAAPSRDDLLVPLEEVLDRVVGPLSQQTPVLLVVLDGCSLAVFHELLPGLLNWYEVGPRVAGRDAGARMYGVSTLPTVTEVARASLLCGRIVRGDAGTERTGFAEHPALRGGRQSPRLFHKDTITDSRLGLSDEAQQSIAGSHAPRVVGVVLNAIDDWLSKGDQDAAAWTIDRIRPMIELLQCAADGQRAIVITSDHGHVREHASRYVEGKEGARHRRGGNANDGELLVRGPRVALYDGEIVVPWTESLRYSSSKQHGYHGGISPQEVLVPLSIFVRPGIDLDGYEQVPVVQPGWWESSEVQAEPRPKTTPKATPPRTKVPQKALLPFAGLQRNRIDALLQSKVYAAQVEAAGKMRVAPERVAEILLALDERGGSATIAALSAKLGLPLARVHTYLTALRRTLNFDGVEVVGIDTSSNTVRVDWNLLRVQFDLGEEK
ncbi:MAG: BREX-2 system phosphatase PglZ [Planctomycetota bacterium]